MYNTTHAMMAATIISKTLSRLINLASTGTSRLLGRLILVFWTGFWPRHRLRQWGIRWMCIYETLKDHGSGPVIYSRLPALGRIASQSHLAAEFLGLLRTVLSIPRVDREVNGGSQAFNPASYRIGRTGCDQ